MVGFLICMLHPDPTYGIAKQRLDKKIQPVTVHANPWLRLSGAAHHLKLNKTERFLAYTDQDGHNLTVLDLTKNLTYRVTKHKVGAGAFWAPDGWRLFFRALSKTNKGELKAELKVYDMAQHKAIHLETHTSLTGFPTFDPRDFRLSMVTPQGVRTKKLVLPDERLARWQIAQRHDSGTWLVTDRAVLRLTDGGMTMNQVSKKNVQIQSFHISADGRSIAWADADGNIHRSTDGQQPQFVAKGRDPQWHPQHHLLAFSRARYIGDHVSGFDLAIMNEIGDMRTLTRTDLTHERWPTWTPDGRSLIFAADHSTDLMRIKFESPWR